MVFILLSFLAVAHCADLQSTSNSNEEEYVEPINQLTEVNGGQSESHESTTAASAVSERSGRQYYQPSAAMFAYQPYSQYPQRRAYKGSQSKKKPMRTKSGSRRPGRPAGSRPRKPSPMAMQMTRYRRLPQPMRAQQVNYIDPAGVDYGDVPMSFDYDDPATATAAAYMYGHAGQMSQAAPPVAVMTSSGRSRKRPAMAGYADESHQTVVHVPVRVTRPAAIPTVAVTVADPMDKLRQMVHEAMDEHFASRHQELYTDGFDKQRMQVYSAKYKRQQEAADKDKLQQRTADAIKSTTAPLQASSHTSRQKDASYSADVDADGSDDRLTLAQISEYMGAKPAETVLSAGGHRYVLSDALQQSYRQQQQQQQHQQQQQQQQQHYGGEDQHQYVRYVSPFEALYDMPVARWTYK